MSEFICVALLEALLIKFREEKKERKHKKQQSNRVEG